MQAAQRAGLAGLEFFIGIPGTIGGAVRMNAGAFGGETKDRLLWAEAERMAHLQVTDESFKKEIEVVKEERRLRTDDKPRSLVVEQLSATAFQAHPYRRPIIGWMSDLDSLTANDVRQFHRQWQPHL